MPARQTKKTRRSGNRGSGATGGSGSSSRSKAGKTAARSTRRKSQRRPARGRTVEQKGRKLGPRALRTRQRLLDATAELLKERSVLDLSVVEIARKAETSPATFYHYFKDVEEAALLLAEQAAEQMPEVLEWVDESWRGQRGLDTARALVDAFMQHWDAHHAALQIRNLSADRGDPRFQRVRRMALEPLLDRLAQRIEEARQAGRVSDGVHPFAAAAALGSVLERLSAHQRELARRGVTREDLAETCAHILYQVVTGSKAP